MADPARARKLAKRIAQIVATAIEFEIKDSRLEFITVTDAKVTNDLHDATVFYTVRGARVDEEPDLQTAAMALEKARGALRTRVGAGTGVRYTPTLTFVADTVPDAARHMEELLERARRLDAEVALAAAGATPAGDPDPYREPRVRDLEIVDGDSQGSGSDTAGSGGAPGSAEDDDPRDPLAPAAHGAGSVTDGDAGPWVDRGHDGGAVSRG